VFVCGLDERVLLANPAFAALFGRTSDELTGRLLEEVDSAEITGILLEQNAEVLASGATQTFEVAARTATGWRTFQVIKGVCRDADGEVRGVFGVALDITERRRVEQEIIDTSDKEKQRLGRELRENFCQHLVGISLLGNVLYEELSRAGLAQAEFARQIASLVKQVVSEVRTLEKALSVTHLEQGTGLADALEDLAEQARSAGEVECVFRGPRSRQAVEPQTAMYLFRIAQEAVHNALAHSMARRLLIRLVIKREAVILSVRDNGVGFSEKESQRNDTWSRIGFPIMRHRSNALGAKLEIKHIRNGGIEVVCTVPRRRATRRRKSN